MRGELPQVRVEGAIRDFIMAVRTQDSGVSPIPDTEITNAATTDTNIAAVVINPDATLNTSTVITSTTTISLPKPPLLLLPYYHFTYKLSVNFGCHHDRLYYTPDSACTSTFLTTIIISAILTFLKNILHMKLLCTFLIVSSSKEK